MVDFANFDFTPEPHQIEEIYASGFCGTTRGSLSSAALMRSSVPSLHQLMPQSKGIHKRVAVALPIRGAQTVVHENFNGDRGESQRQGDCVGKMLKGQGMIDGCLDHMAGETDWKIGPDGNGVQYCDENWYGDRGHGGEGANCHRIWNLATVDGRQGWLFRDTYTIDGRTYDLSRYRADLSGPWGRSGTPDGLSRLAQKNPALQVLKIRSLEEAMDALAIGMGLGRCGSEGYSNTRNADGLAERKGTWQHAIAVGGYDRTQRILDKYGNAVFLYFHFWGEWNRGPKMHEQPNGSWFVRSSEMQRNINSGSVYAIGSVVGHNRKLIWDHRRERVDYLIKEGFNQAC